MNPPTLNPVSAIAPAAGGLPKLSLAAADGARAEVYLYGAHVVSWVPAGGQEHLFLSRTSAFRAGAPIRGGVPVVFPQFGATGPLPLHGLVRLMAWELTAAEPVGQGAVVTLLVMYPLAVVLGALLGPVMAAVHALLAPLVMMGVMIPLVTYIVMPLAMRVFSPWLFPVAPKPGEGNP